MVFELGKKMLKGAVKFADKMAPAGKTWTPAFATGAPVESRKVPEIDPPGGNWIFTLAGVVAAANFPLADAFRPDSKS